jgi:tRNA dimethylallyltransferase
MITILGPTASGKTSLAARLAYELDGEVISADSRQVYRGMSIGTGKDLSEYHVGDKEVPYHLIDIVDPGYEYNIYEFQHDFFKVYDDILSRGKTPIFCGGSGMYLESVLKKYRLRKKEEGEDTFKALSMKTNDELKAILVSLKMPHNTTDLLDRDRLIRAVQINISGNEPATPKEKNIPVIIFGIHWNRELLRARITGRLDFRLRNGMIEEVEELLQNGLSPEQIKFYGLEYRYITLYLEGKLDYFEMFRLLNIAIHQFAKRQMTWFRRMERQGMPIHWLPGESSLDEKIDMIHSIR